MLRYFMPYFSKLISFNELLKLINNIVIPFCGNKLMFSSVWKISCYKNLWNVTSQIFTEAVT